MWDAPHFHPLVDENLSEMSDAELTDAISDLSRKMTYCQRSGNWALVWQVEAMADSLRHEHNRRLQAAQTQQPETKETEDGWQEIKWKDLRF
ncbi:MAG: hypothetical protein WC284_08510 [Candidimonas sp.]